MKILLFILIFVSSLYSDIIVAKSISHRAKVNDIKIIDGKVFSVADDATIKVWDKDLNLLKTIYLKEKFFNSNLYTLCFDKNNIYVAGTYGFDNPILVFDRATLKLKKAIKNNFYGINKIKSNGKYICAVGSDFLYIFDKNLNFLYKQEFEKFNKTHGMIYDVVFLDKDRVAFVNWDGYVIVFDIKNKKVSDFKKFDDRLQSIEFHNDKLYVGGYNNVLYILDKNLKQIKTLYMNHSILSMQSIGSYIALSGDGGFDVLENDKIIYSQDTKLSKAIAFDGFDIYVASYEKIIKYKLKQGISSSSKEHILKPKCITLLSDNIDIDSLNISFDITTRFLHNQNDILSPFGKNLKFDDYELKLDTALYTYDTIEIYKDSKFINRFKRDASSGYGHHIVLRYEDYIISSGDFGWIFVYHPIYGIVSKLLGFSTNIIDMSIYHNTLAVLSAKGEVGLYNLNTKQYFKRPFAKITFFKDGSFLIKSGNYFYSTNLNNVECIKTDGLDLKRSVCIPYKKTIQHILKNKTPLPKPVVDLSMPSNKLQIDRKIKHIFNLKDKILIKDDSQNIYYLDKKSKKLHKIKYETFFSITDVLEDGGYIYLLNTYGEIIKFDKDFNFIAKTNLKINRFKTKNDSYHLEKTPKYIVAKYNDTIRFYNKDLKYKFHIKITGMDSFWTIIDGYLFFELNNKLFKYDIKKAKLISYIPIDSVKIKTPTNKIVVRKGDTFYLVDKNLKKDFLFRDKNIFINFFKGDDNHFYAISDNDMLKFEGDELIFKGYLKNDEIDIFAGVAQIEWLVSFDLVYVNKQNDLYSFHFLSQKSKLLLKTIKPIEDLWVGKNYVVASNEKYLYIYDKNLKLLKKLKSIPYESSDEVYIKDGKLYISSYILNLKTFKIKKTKNKKALKIKKNSIVKYKELFDTLTYKDKVTNVYYRLRDVFLSDDYIGVYSKDGEFFVYDKNLNIIANFILDKKATNVKLSSDNILYYTIGDKVYKFVVSSE